MVWFIVGQWQSYAALEVKVKEARHQLFGAMVVLIIPPLGVIDTV